MRRVIIFVPLLTILIGCVATYHVKVDSISRFDARAKKNYIMLPYLKEIDSNDLQFMEFSSYVERALSKSGYTKTGDFREADIAIFLAYGIGDPKEHIYSYSLPVWGQTGVSSSTTYGRIQSFGNLSTYRGTTTYTPTYGITGYKTQVGSYTTLLRFLVLEAIDLEEYRQSKKITPLWRTTVASRGSSGDLRQVFPVLLTAAMPYIGANTGRQVDVTLTEWDKAVLEIKGLTK